MYFKFPCEHCGKSLKVSEENVGRRARCPYCHKAITIPHVTAADIPVATPRGKRATPSTSKRAKGGTSGGTEWSIGTNIALTPSAIIGVILTVIFFSILFPFKTSYFGNLFIKTDTGSWVPYALVFLMGWSVGILVLKQRKHRRQKDSMLFDVVPTDIAEEINPENLDKFVEHIRSLPAKPSESFLINRVIRGLEHFRVRKSHSEVAGMMSSQSDIDANAVESSYTIVKVFIWAIPILGFIGTVVGISAAVKGFSGSMDQAANIDVLKTSLNNVTSGLATAFDTTLVALVMSLLVSFWASAVQKAEEDLLNWVDEYCNENVLKRLDDGIHPAAAAATDALAAAGAPVEHAPGVVASLGAAGAPPDAQTLRLAVEQALANHHAELESWKQKIESVGSTITSQVADGWTEMHHKLQQDHEEKLTQLNNVVSTLSGDENLSDLAAEVRDAIKTLREETQSVQSEVAESMRESATSLRTYFNGLTEGLAALNEVLGNLGEKQIKIETHAARRGWFGGRKNGG